MALTTVTEMINPEVMAQMISAELPNKIAFSQLATIDTTLVGQPGNTITVPKFIYIGDAEDVAEGVAMGTTILTSSSTQVTIKKAAKAVELTDESILVGYGDPVGEANGQLLMSIASKVDTDCETALGDATLAFVGTTKLSYAGVVDAIDIFKEEEDEAKVMFIHPNQLTTLRKDPDFLDITKYPVPVMMTGVIGTIAGCQVKTSRRVLSDATTFTNFIVKAGALKIYMKRAVKVEVDRDILAGTNVIACNEHYVAHLADETKVVKVTFLK